ncbi:hypothetical protein GCM10023160_23560 [Brachybacterium paraconglomeratum]
MPVMSITIRRAVVEDLDAVRFIGFSTWPPTYGPLKGARYVLDALDSYWSADALRTAIEAGGIDVAETAQGVVGMAEVAELGDDLVLWKLYVLPSQQRSGIGHELISAAKDRARARRRGLLTEYVSENSDAGRFYEREGFVPTAAPWPGTAAAWVRWQDDPGRIFTLRPATTEDAHGCAAVHHASWVETYSELLPASHWETDTLEQRAATWQRWLDGGVAVTVAESAGQIIGLAIAHTGRQIGPHAPVRDRELYSLYVLSAHHGSGAGQALLEAVLPADVPAQLWVAAENPRARRFYERNGFTPDGARHVDETLDLAEVRLVR